MVIISVDLLYSFNKYKSTLASSVLGEIVSPSFTKISNSLPF